MMESSNMCGDAAMEENVNTETEEEHWDQNVDEGGDAGSEGWRTPPEDLVGASSSASSTVILVMLIIRRRSLQKVGGRLQRLLDEH